MRFLRGTDTRTSSGNGQDIGKLRGISHLTAN
jgi:hypothetical protein